VPESVLYIRKRLRYVITSTLNSFREDHMARRKPAASAEEQRNPAELQETQPQQEQPTASDAPAASPQRKSTWVARFGYWTDNEAGVRLIEDRQNRQMTIKFVEKPSEAVRTLMKSDERGFRFDPEDQVWYKRINPAKPRQSREEAEQLAFEAANLIRAEKGLEQRKAFSIGM
jgi:hypothetical protein